MRLLRRPRERLVHIALVDQLAHERALLGRALHRLEQREEFCPIARGRVFAQRLAERHVLEARVLRELRRVGREEREGPRGITLVLREVKADAPDHVPRRARRREKPLQRAARVRGGRPHERGVRRSEEREDHLGGEVLGARHRRRGLGERSKLLAGDRSRSRVTGRTPRRRRAGDAEDRVPELPRPRERRRERRGRLGRREVQDSLALARKKRRCDARGRRVVERGPALVVGHAQVTARRERQSGRHEPRRSEERAAHQGRVDVRGGSPTSKKTSPTTRSRRSRRCQRASTSCLGGSRTS